MDGAGGVALLAPGAGEEFANGKTKRGGGKVPFEGGAFFEHWAIEHVEVGVVFGGGFGLEVREKLRV